MTEFELTTLDCHPLATDELARRAGDWLRAPGAAGRLLAAFRTEVGQLGRLILLRCFDSTQEAAAERARTLTAQAPFGGREVATAYRQESYRQFPFLPPLRQAQKSAIYEIRSYELRPGGLPATIAAWERAIEPAAGYTRHLVTCMYATDGAPRIVHIWGFDSFEERLGLRASHYAAGTWPPKGGPQQIARACSTLAFDAPGLERD